MSEYLLEIKATIDALIVVDYDATREHMVTILDGLLGDYDAFVASTSTRVKPFTVSEIEALLLSQEARVEGNKLEALSLESLSFNLVNTQITNQNLKNFQSGRGNFNNFKPNFSNNGGRSNNAYQNRGRGRRSGNNNSNNCTNLRWCVRSAISLGISPQIISTDMTNKTKMDRSTQHM